MLGMTDTQEQGFPLRSLIRIAITAALLAVTLACQDDVLGPDPAVGKEPEVEVRTEGDTTRNGSLSRGNVKMEGEVRETGNGGVEVKGSVHLETAHGRASFLDADMQLRFAADGSLQSASGRAKIPPPSERISFSNPVEAAIGFFSGRELNRNGLVGIPLKDDTDYFVYRIVASFEMRIATGDTGEGAVRPIVIRAPLGGEILMVVDYTDPMYYVYGAQDLIGAAGFGWSGQHRIPFIPQHPVLGLGAFDGGTTRTGTFPVWKVFSVTGQLVENEQTVAHVSLQDPFSSSLRMDYQAGINGQAQLDLFLKDIVGLEIPLAEASGGIWREASTTHVFRGHAYLNGVTTNDLSWWPAFIPIRPVARLTARAAIESGGSFEAYLAGELGWDLPSGRTAMSGEFSLTPDALAVTGTVMVDNDRLSLLGSVTKNSTTAAIRPPQSLLDGIRSGVLQDVDSHIDRAEKAWNDLQKATGDYQFELSLRGLRSSLPTMVQTARNYLTSTINSELNQHKGKVYYNSLKSHVTSAAAPYYTELDRLERAAGEIRDNVQTRREIEAALRSVAARKRFTTTYTYKVLGVTVATVRIDVQVVSDANANKLIQAANNVKYIEETSDTVISMQQIYDAIPMKEFFAQLRKDIDAGVGRIPTLSEFGFVIHHGDRSLNLYAVLGDERRELGRIDPFDLAAVARALASRIMVDLTS